HEATGLSLGFLECGGTTPLWTSWMHGSKHPKDPKRCRATALQECYAPAAPLFLRGRLFCPSRSDRQQGMGFQRGRALLGSESQRPALVPRLHLGTHNVLQGKGFVFVVLDPCQRFQGPGHISALGLHPHDPGQRKITFSAERNVLCSPQRVLVVPCFCLLLRDLPHERSLCRCPRTGRPGRSIH